MTRDEKLVADFLELKGLRAEGFSKEEMDDSKTPDFRVFKGEDFAFYCEVKTLLQDEWFNQQLDAAGPVLVVGGLRTDSTYNRVSQKVYEAVKQFDAVNPKLINTNVLALVNHDSDLNVSDLDSVITGCFFAENGEAYPIFAKYSEGRIRDKKGHVHLFVWIDYLNGQAKPYFRFNLDASEHRDKLSDCFGVDLDSIRKFRVLNKHS